MIRVSCTNCGEVLAVKDSFAGKRGKCPKCGDIMVVPLVSEPSPETESPSQDPLVAIASNAASSVASAAGSAASAVGNAVTGLFKRSGEKTVITTNDGQQPNWLAAFTRDNQSREVVRTVADKVNAILMADEHLTYIAVQNKPILNISPDCIALTNKRFIFYRPKLLGRVDFEDFVWRDLHDAKLSENIIGSTIRIMAADGKMLSLDYLPKSQARAVYRIAQEMEEISLQQRRDRSLEEKRAGAGGVVVQTALAAPPSQPETVNKSDPMQKLQTLKSMLDAGLITQSEFDAKKMEILASF